ncbi:homeodomain-containing protein [Ordospora colligata]|uniref:Homeodomain-containing protein n=1 Tax=Ordospora colligata OC4 TaxID=1354746 RepID=A0A0B2UL00_9MICR|nr:homeodomain-containing protein [Ordospora colligata OC4]KHN69944.1 homeodomain-containing protein [Ordospora colligata OC4]TBU16114.1 homeodomain-containing protein [Ordospora colligata]TBU16327.1 homeodomain-containing protein [Ordospora colligata]TBU19031.1 homeodomain-containing protein [Ordospora colligata]
MNRKVVEYKIIDSKKDIAKIYDTKERPKRIRMILSEWQSMMLEQAFRMNPYPGRAEKYNMFMKTRIPMKNINIWFQNRRAKERSLYEEGLLNIDHPVPVWSEIEIASQQICEDLHKYYRY